MTARASGRPKNALRPFLLSVLLLLVAAGCGDGAGDGEGSRSSPISALSYLETPGAERLPEDAFAIGWDGVGEPRVIRQQPLPEGYEVETVVDGLANPVGLAFLPDGRALVGEQHIGHIRVIEDDALREEPFAIIENVVQGRLELGLLGIAVDPEFEENHWVYAFYVEADSAGQPGRSVLLRFTERDGFGVEPTELAEFPATATDKHNGGGLKFGPDGKLYLTIGDTDRAEQASDPAQPIGKIFRLNRDGSAPADNPLFDRPDADPRVFAYGFRNPFGIAFHPDLPGRLIAPDNSVAEFDEINIVRPGGYYGWWDSEGFTDREGIENPIWVYLTGVAPAGTEVYTGDRLAEFQGDVFFCQFMRAALHRLRFSEDFRRVQFDTVIATGCTASVAQGPDGFLYFVDRQPRGSLGGRVLRIVGP